MRCYNIEIYDKKTLEVKLEYVTSAIDRADANRIAKSLEEEVFDSLEESQEVETKINQISEEEYLKHF